MKKKTRKDYIEELKTLVDYDCFYIKLFYVLENTPFIATLEMDENRVLDAKDLRKLLWYYGKEQVSVFEILVTLAVLMENEIMHNDKFGDRTAKWFWMMLENMRLTEYPDSRFDEEVVKNILENFIFRKYNRKGEIGCPFPIEKPPKDLRKKDLWYQMNWYVTAYLSEEY